MNNMLILSGVLIAAVTSGLSAGEPPVEFEQTVAAQCREAITNLVPQAAIFFGHASIVVKTQTHQERVRIEQRTTNLPPVYRLKDVPTDAGFILSLRFRNGPYNEPRFLESAPHFRHTDSTNHYDGTAALVEFPATNVYMVADITFGRSCDINLLNKIYEVLLNHIELAFGEPWHGFPGRGLSEPKDGMSISDQYRRRYQVPRN